MKKLIKNIYASDDIFGMANVSPKRSGLSVIIWSEHDGVSRNVSHSNTPRLKIGTNNYWAVYTIEPEPKLKTSSKNIKKSDMKKIQTGVEYVARNYDLFLKHYYDTDFSFDDEDLFNALRERGEYK